MELEDYQFTKQELKYLELLSEKYPTVQSVCTEIINLKAILNLPKGTEHFMSDVHGEYEAFYHILNNCSGVIHEKVNIIFGDRLSVEERAELCTLIYYPEERLEIVHDTIKDLESWYKITLNQLIEICKLVASKYTRSKVRKALPKEFSYIIDELLHSVEGDINQEAYHSNIMDTIISIHNADEFIIALATLIKRLAVDHLHIVGDIFDRGPRADSIMDMLMQHHAVDIQWGNHDILWMGAASGQKVCIANAVRISARYANLDIVEDIYGINLLPLATFALEAYKDDPCTEFMPKVGEGEVSTKEKSLIAKMHKAISIIQFKLEGEVIKRRPEFEMDHRLLLDKVDYEAGTINLKGKVYKLKDTNFPTIDPKSPYKLTKEEEDLVDKLVASFRGSEKLQKHVSFLFSKGSIYLIANKNLLVHGCIPLDSKGDFMSMKINGKEYKGRELMDQMDSYARKGFFYKKSPEKQFGMDIMWYLWTGKCSSLFGKDDMTTYERYFIADKKTHVENKNPYYTLREDENICNKIFDEFGLDYEQSHIITGHVPVESKKGESPIKAGGKILVIDGGFSRAYQGKTGIAGYTLIYNSYTLQLVAHEPFSSAEDAIKKESDILSTSVVVEDIARRMYVRDTLDGEKMQEEINDLKMLLLAYKKGLIKEK